MKFTEYFCLNKSQKEIDFVDVNLDRDIPLFIDSFAIQMRNDEWADRAISAIEWFFELVIKCISDWENEKAKRLLINKDPQEICLWFSKKWHSWKSVWPTDSNHLFDSFANSKAIKSWLLEDLEDSILFVDNIWKDKISDLVWNIIKKFLIEYTQNQCELYSIPTEERVAINLFWDDVNLKWWQWYFNLPVCNDKPIILVPKSIVRLDSVFKYDEYYSKFVLEFLQAQHLNNGSSLVEVLKNGKSRVTKKKLEEKHPLTKDFLVNFTEKNNEVLLQYKEVKKRNFSYIDDKTINSISDQEEDLYFFDNLIWILDNIEKWNWGAGELHDTIINVINSIFIPNIFTSPKKESSIHSWRKRIDIVYFNNASSGFFYKLQNMIPSWKIIIECKNYEWDPKNPELDQLSWRFSPTRWQFGLLICRNISNKNLFNQRCIDTAKDSRWYIMALDDTDIKALINFKKNWQDNNINNFFESKWNELFSSIFKI